MDASLFPEILIRGATAGVLVLLSILLTLRGRGFGTQRIGALFLFATAAYTIISSPPFAPLLGPMLVVFKALATFNSVFFWWFATSLFDDEFEWKAWRFIPFGLIAALYTVRYLAPDLISPDVDNLLHQVVVIAMMGHALWLVLAHRKDDLVEPRRRFRLLFAALAGVFGILIAVGELLIGTGTPPQSTMLLHAIGLFVLTFGFSAWLLRPVDVFAPSLAPPQGGVSGIAPEDKVELDRLERLMQSGVYLQEDLSISVLAGKLNIPEHRLRRLINGGLGFRNFSAFLNQHRLADARKILADPEQARRQITQIALDLGYGSVGPFNRAFKVQTGQTPTEFRRNVLS